MGFIPSGSLLKGLYCTKVFQLMAVYRHGTLSRGYSHYYIQPDRKSSTKNKSSLIICSPLYCLKPVRFSFYNGTTQKIFCRMLKLLFSIYSKREWLWMEVANFIYLIFLTFQLVILYELIIIYYLSHVLVFPFSIFMWYPQMWLEKPGCCREQKKCHKSSPYYLHTVFKSSLRQFYHLPYMWLDFFTVSKLTVSLCQLRK